MNTEAIKAAVQSALDSIHAVEADLGWTGDSQSAIRQLNEAISALSASAEQQPIGEMREGGVVWFDQNPHAYPVGTKFYTAPQASQPSDNYHDAYRGAREEMEIWKKRALEAEESSRRLVAAINEENGPTHMGEPAIRTSQPSAWDQAIEDFRKVLVGIVPEQMKERHPFDFKFDDDNERAAHRGEVAGWNNCRKAVMDAADTAFRALRQQAPAAQTAPVNVPEWFKLVDERELLKIKHALESCDAGDYSTGSVIHPSYDEKAVEDALNSVTVMIAAAPSAPIAANSEDAKDKERTRLLAQAKKDVATVLRVEGLDLEIGSRKLLKEVISAIDAATAQQKGGE